MTQTEWLIQELEKGRKLTQMTMLNEFGIGNHTGRIDNARKALLKRGDAIIVTEMVGDGRKEWAEYHLEWIKVGQLALV